MRRILSVLLSVLATANIFAPNAIAAPDPSPVVMVAAPAPNPAPAPVAFTGGDASYEAMCALAGMVVAAPDGAQHPGNVETCFGEFTVEYESDTTDTSNLFHKYRVKICINGEWTTRWSYIKASDTSAVDVMAGIFARYDTAGGECSPPMPTCTTGTNGTKWYKMIVDAGGGNNPPTSCPHDGETMWIDSDYEVIRRTSMSGVDLLLDMTPQIITYWDAWRPFKRPTDCTQLQISCADDITGSCTNNPDE